MADRPPKSLTDVLQVAVRLFEQDEKHTAWSAVEEVLRGLDPRRITQIYRASREPWCREALAAGDDALISWGVEQLGLQLRRIPKIRDADDVRLRTQTRRPQRRGGPAPRGRH